MRFTILVLCLGFLAESPALAKVGYIFPQKEEGKANTLLISGKDGHALNEVLQAVPAWLLVGISGVQTDYRTETGSSTQSPFLWISAKDNALKNDVDYDKVFGSLLKIGRLKDGRYFIHGLDIINFGSFPQVIKLGLRSVENANISCETREIGAGSIYPGFNYTACFFAAAE